LKIPSPPQESVGVSDLSPTLMSLILHALYQIESLGFKEAKLNQMALRKFLYKSGVTRLILPKILN